MSGNDSKVPSVPINEHSADLERAEVDDPITRELMALCVAKARMKFMRWHGMSEAEWRAQLPVSPFDMRFFVSVMKDVFSNKQVIRRILDGESIASATEWDA